MEGRSDREDLESIAMKSGEVFVVKESIGSFKKGDRLLFVGIDERKVKEGKRDEPRLRFAMLENSPERSNPKDPEEGTSVFTKGGTITTDLGSFDWENLQSTQETMTEEEITALFDQFQQALHRDLDEERS